MTASRDPDRIELRVNGDAFAIENGATVEALVRRLAPAEARVAVERNAQIVRHAEWSTTRLEPGDRIEIVKFVQGG